MKRIIFHIDQNCYFASVEMISRPELRNVPMAVAGDAKVRHGIILAKNEPAKKYGIKTAEAIWQAQAKCPDLVLVDAHHEKYEFYSKKLREMYSEYTDKVEPFGLDECWLDMTGIVSDYDEAEEVALEIRNRVKEEFKLTCSVGISFNKVFAKLGSDYKKPDATTVFTDRNWQEKIWPLPVSDLLFVGKHTADKLAKINVKTIGDLAKTDVEFINRYLGKNGVGLWEYANGLDDSPVAESGYKRIPKSVGNSTTTAEDMTSDRQIERTLHMLSESVASRLRRHGLKGTVVQITVRDRDLGIYEKQGILYRATDDAKDIYQAARDLFKNSYDWNKGVRSIGVRCTKLVRSDSGEQLSLFAEAQKSERDERLNKAIDDINRRYGTGVIRSAAEAESASKENKADNIVKDPFHPEDGF
ncbi:MAG: DNA polymerase IV [Clostridiales bacterium]|nr:DNA polymerase IV [Clostridiales bacterium]MBQ2155559.1 DNA polymerase IV [Clostridiales bacterium]MBR3701607.1 DNA polymerase IV [Clostridiales bacterium]